MIEELKKEKLGHDIAALPDHIVGRAEYLKDYFDRNAYEVLKECFNPLIDELMSEEGAQNIGAEGFSVVPAGTVQSQLAYLKTLMDEAQWGIPDSCDTQALKDGAVTLDKLADEVSEQLDRVFYSLECIKEATDFLLTGLLSDDICAVRFTADAAYEKGDTLTVNGESYTLMLPNGKALPDNAWIADAVVCLQLNPETKTAFFNGGGVDLSFITAGAEQILSGYVGADAEGEPVEGNALSWFSGEVVTKQVTVTTGTKGVFYGTVTYDKKPKMIVCMGIYGSTPLTDINPTTHDYSRLVWIDGVLSCDDVSGSYSYETLYFSFSEITDTSVTVKIDMSTSYYGNKNSLYFELYY